MDFNINNFRDLNFASKFHNLPKFDGGFWVIPFTKHYQKGQKHPVREAQKNFPSK